MCGGVSGCVWLFVRVGDEFVDVFKNYLERVLALLLAWPPIFLEYFLLASVLHRYALSARIPVDIKSLPARGSLN